MGVSLDGMVVIDLDPHALQALAVGFRTCLAVEMGDHHAVDAEATVHELVTEAQHVHIVGYSQVAAHFVLLDVNRTDDYDDFRIVFHLHQHLQFAVRLKSGEDAACVIVVEKLAAEFQVKFVAEGGDPLLDVL